MPTESFSCSLSLYDGENLLHTEIVSLPNSPARARYYLDRLESETGKELWAAIAGKAVIKLDSHWRLRFDVDVGDNLRVVLGPPIYPSAIEAEEMKHRRSRKLIGKRGRTLGCTKFKTFRGDHPNKVPKALPPKEIILFPQTEEK